MNRKKIALLASILMVTLVVGVYAGLQISNTLTAEFTVAESAPLVLSWSDGNPNGWTCYKGIWYNTRIRLENPTEATFKVLLHFKITAGGAVFPENSVKIKYWEVTTSTWEDLSLSGWNTWKLSGTYGPSEGFPCTPHYNVDNGYQFMFDGNAPLAGYTFEVWVEQM